MSRRRKTLRATVVVEISSRYLGRTSEITDVPKCLDDGLSLPDRLQHGARFYPRRHRRHWLQLRQRTIGAQVCPGSANVLRQPLLVFVGRSIDYRLCLYTIIAAEFADPIVVQNRGVRGNVQRPVSRDKLPDKVIASLDNVLRLADVFRALLVRVQFRSASGFPQGDQTSLYRRPTGHHERIVRPLQIEERVLKGIRSGGFRIYTTAHPPGNTGLLFLSIFQSGNTANAGY